MEIRKTKTEELHIVMKIYQQAQQFMADYGNPEQWGFVHPSQSMIVKDIEEGKSYVCVEEDKIAAVFYYAIEEDPTYIQIVDGAWKNNKPYGVIHRLASSSCVKSCINACGKDITETEDLIVAEGAGEFCLKWAEKQCGNIRIDTHKDNVPMQNLLKKCGFEYCGIIYIANGDERMAFQKAGYAKEKAFLGSLDFMKLGQAVNHEQWQSAAMIIQRMTRNAKDAQVADFDRLFTGIRQNINRKNVYETKQLLALVMNKRVQLIGKLKKCEEIVQ